MTVTLKGWKWSDGMQITARDIQFWQNLVTANKATGRRTSPGEYPDNVLSTTINPSNPLADHLQPQPARTARTSSPTTS